MPPIPTNSGLRDNYTRGTVADFLKGKIQDGSRLSVVSAYFTIYAYDALKDCLDRIDHLDFLFGEPSYVNRLDPSKTEKKAFIIDSDGLALSNRLQQKRVAKECAEWIEQKVDIKTIKRSNLLHGKMYHVATSGVEDAILGSSNFTVRGLGLGDGANNIELNLIVDSNRDRHELKQWFKEVWDDEKLVKDVKEDVLLDLRKLDANQPPQLIYYLTLFHLFRDYLDGTRDVDDNIRRVALPETRIWRTLFTFQKDGAKAAINKILDYNGCILADSVGLGKTYTALAVIKYFEQRNERVLVLCPKKLSRNWTIYRNPSSLNPFSDDKFRYDVLHHTDLSRESGNVNGLELDTLNWGAYDLVVIDESHNFRNNKLATQRPGDKEERRSRYQRLMEDIISAGVKTKVLLLSATPVNNQLADLRNQISFIAGGDVARNDVADGAFAEKLNILSVRDTSRQAQTQFTNWAKKPPGQRKTRELIAAIGGDFFKLLDGLSIARSRSQIAAYYAGEMKELGGFPRRPAPKAIHAAIDLERRFLSFEQLDTEISALRLALYHPTSFLRDDIPVEVRAAYENKILGGFTQEGRERILIAMMKVNLLKRLESSVDSFRLTLERTIAKTDQLEERITAFEKHLDDNPDLDYDSLTPDQFEDPDFDEEDFTIGGRRRIHLSHLKLPEWLKAVRNDRTQLQFLLKKTQSVTAKRDGKLVELKAFIEAKVRQPTTNRDGKANRKVLVFTAFADTARYLHEHLDPWARKELRIHTGLVCGDGGNAASLGRTDYDDILTNFSPIAKRRADQAPRFSNQREEIDLLIATDCISEGQNLQDCDLLVNYDIH
jgi:SNF2 family DNA or RNA helicase